MSATCLSWLSPIQSIYPHSTSWRSILILTIHLRLGLPIGLFPSCFRTKNLYTPPPPHPYASVILTLYKNKKKVKVKWSRYRSGVAQRVGRGIAILFHDRGTRREWVVSSTPRPHFTPGKGQVPILQEAGWAPGPVWSGGKPRPQRDSIPDRPVRSSVTIPTELPGPH